MKQPKIFTIGYEGATVEMLVQALKNAGIKLLIDVRAVPMSRKPGFSKNKLAARLLENGINYLGLKGLGTPAEGREAARKGRIGDLKNIYTAHLQTEDAIRDMAEAARVAMTGPACLLCFEHAPSSCHRLLVAEEIASRTGQSIEHLNPASGLLD